MDPSEKFERLIDEATPAPTTTYGVGQKVRTSNGEFVCEATALQRAIEDFQCAVADPNQATGVSLEDFQRASEALANEFHAVAASERKEYMDKFKRISAASSAPGFTAGRSYVVGQTVSTPTGKFQCTASGTAASGMCAGPDAATGETGIHFYDEGTAKCRCGARTSGSRPTDIIVHIANHYNPDPAMVDAFASEAGQKAALEVVRFGNPVRRRAEETATCRAVESGHLDVHGAWVADPVQVSRGGLDDTTFNSWPSVPPPRPDGFSQAAVDAAKAVLLAPVAKRGGR